MTINGKERRRKVTLLDKIKQGHVG